MAYTRSIPRICLNHPLFAPVLWWVGSVLYFYLGRPAIRGESFRMSFLSSVRFATKCRRSWRYLSSLAEEPPAPAPAWGGAVADYD